jgi:hypothetical protein
MMETEPRHNSTARFGGTSQADLGPNPHGSPPNYLYAETGSISTQTYGASADPADTESSVLSSQGDQSFFSPNQGTYNAAAPAGSLDDNLSAINQKLGPNCSKAPTQFNLSNAHSNDLSLAYKGIEITHPHFDDRNLEDCLVIHENHEYAGQGLLSTNNNTPWSPFLHENV